MPAVIYQKPVFTAKTATISLGNFPPLTTISISISPVRMQKEIRSLGGSSTIGHMTRFVCHAVLDIEQLPKEWQDIQGGEQPRIDITTPSEEHNLSQATVKYFDKLSKEFVIEAFSFR